MKSVAPMAPSTAKPHYRRALMACIPNCGATYKEIPPIRMDLTNIEVESSKQIVVSVSFKEDPRTRRVTGRSCMGEPNEGPNQLSRHKACE